MAIQGANAISPFGGVSAGAAASAAAGVSAGAASSAFAPPASEIALRERWLLMRLLAAGHSRSKLADRLLGEHGSLGSILAASEERLRQLGADANGIAILGLVRETLRALRERSSFDGQPIRSGLEFAEQIFGEMAWLPVEQVRVAYLDSLARLQRVEVLGVGTPRKAHFYPREIARRALELYAASVILVHNHPSGDPTPSAEDIAVTRKTGRALESVDVDLLDHVVIARAGVVSFVDSGLI